MRSEKGGDGGDRDGGGDGGMEEVEMEVTEEWGS